MSLEALVVGLAREHRAGAVGLAGAHAAGEPVDLLVADLDRAAPLALALAEATDAEVRLWRVGSLLYSHPLHFCVRWLNVDRLPTCPFPRGAALRLLNGVPIFAPLESFPHLRAVDHYERPRPERPRVVPAPPLGGFLL